MPSVSSVFSCEAGKPSLRADSRISPGSPFSSASNVVSEDEDRERSEAPGKIPRLLCPHALAPPPARCLPFAVLL